MDASLRGNSPGAGSPWAVYDQSLLLSGLLSIALMSLTMMLALRPGWLERPLGGLDQIYRTHKWAGILAVVFAAAHWLIEMGDDVIESIFGKAGKLHDQDYSGFIDTMRDAAEEVGEFAVYLLSHFSLNLSEILHKISAIKSEWGKQ